jgi:hypothetical protein
MSSYTENPPPGLPASGSSQCSLLGSENVNTTGSSAGKQEAFARRDNIVAFSRRNARRAPKPLRATIHVSHGTAPYGRSRPIALSPHGLQELIAAALRLEVERTPRTQASGRASEGQNRRRHDRRAHARLRIFTTPILVFEPVAKRLDRDPARRASQSQPDP